MLIVLDLVLLDVELIGRCYLGLNRLVYGDQLIVIGAGLSSATGIFTNICIVLVLQQECP